ncbi:DUF2092 domain-containing protein [Crenobacter sp. SG2303]|uniref:DUF2092 domain-containing protein n=1 Tax=Crenobacter oryzisoli TaxID=3056844 RepID=A0ABT7XNQ8_9NEIS|nr:DUF2092 domain-containing protein [Crenobacter sp. SG2303]MDN0075436.1 DUF2092 domain-containing protein [Crenobacter sp. SG2303]
MFPNKLVITLALTTLLIMPFYAVAETIEPDALAALKHMGNYLRSLKSFSIQARSATDLVLDNGQKIQSDSSLRLSAVRPNKLYFNSTSALRSRELFYNGKTLTVYTIGAPYYARVTAPPTIGALLDVAAKNYGIEFPLADLFYWGTDKDNESKLTGALRVGPELINGKSCQLYAFRQENVDWQVCMTEGHEILPIKLVVTTTNDPVQPQHVTYLQWDVKARLAESAFEFHPPKGTQHVELAPQPTSNQ